MSTSPFSLLRRSKKSKTPKPVRRHTVSSALGTTGKEAVNQNQGDQAGNLPDVSVSHLIAAFEQQFLDDNQTSAIQREDYEALFAKQTVRIKSRSRVGTNFKELFPGTPKRKQGSSPSVDSSPEQSQEQSEIEAISIENWKDLDTARKERRISAFLKRRPSAKSLLSSTLQQVIPDKDSLLDVQKQEEEIGTLMVSLPCDGWCIELGYRTTNFETQMKYLCLLETETQQYYEKYFFGEAHANWYADDDFIGPVVISIQSEGQGEDKHRANSRVLIRTKKTDIWDFVEASSSNNMFSELRDKGENKWLQELKFKRIKSADFPFSLLTVERKLRLQHMKFGVLYVKPGQTTDDEILSNNETITAFTEFLDFLGERIVLEGWNKFSGGLDVKHNTTGKESFFVEYQDREVMFHVAPLLPYHENDPQRVERKRHIGNDIVVIVFLEDVESCCFDPRGIKSEFNHVFAIVAVDKQSSTPNELYYKVAFAYKEPMEPCAPFLPVPSVYKKGSEFREFFLTKLINAEHTAIRSPMFAQKLARTKAEQLRNLVQLLDEN